jgi:hypothetical protein
VREGAVALFVAVAAGPSPGPTTMMMMIMRIKMMTTTMATTSFDPLARLSKTDLKKKEKKRQSANNNNINCYNYSFLCPRACSFVVVFFRALTTDD